MDERQTSRWDSRVFFAVLLALLGAWVSFTLTGVHLSEGQSRPALFRAVCEMTGGGCDKILQSPWAMLPRHIPVAFAGLVYFSVLALWYLVVGRPNRAGRVWYLPVFVLQLFGALFSLYLLAVMLFQIHAVCGWCVLVDTLNLILFVLAWKLWPRGPRGAESGWPPARLGVAALLLMVVTAAFWNEWIVGKMLYAEAARFRGDTDLMRYLYFRNPPRPLPLRADDPARGSATPAHTIVVYSDFLCPACRNFAGFFKREILPMPGGDRLRLIYKHLPLDTECNPQLPKTLHPGACRAAYAAEAARELGGADAFWKMHDALFAKPDDIQNGRWAEIAAAAGLDGAAIAQRVAQRSHFDRVSEDAKNGMSLNLKGTPGIFIDGRYLEDWTNPDLWKAILSPTGGAPTGAPAAPAGGPPAPAGAR